MWSSGLFEYIYLEVPSPLHGQEDTAESQTGKEKNMELRCSEMSQGSESPLVTIKEHPDCVFEERLCKGLYWSLNQGLLPCQALVPQSWVRRS